MSDFVEQLGSFIDSNQDPMDVEQVKQQEAYDRNRAFDGLQEINRNKVVNQVNDNERFNKLMSELQILKKDNEISKSKLNELDELKIKFNDVHQLADSHEIKMLKQEIDNEINQIKNDPIYSKGFNEDTFREYLFKQAKEGNGMMPLEAIDKITKTKFREEFLRLQSEEEERKKTYDQTLSKPIPRSDKEQTLLDRARGASQEVKDMLSVKMLEEMGY
jgi:hypothetical protein